MFKILSFLFILAVISQINVIKLLFWYGMHFVGAVMVESVLQQLCSLDIKLLKVKHKIRNYVFDLYYSYTKSKSLSKGKTNRKRQRQRKGVSKNKPNRNINLNEGSIPLKIKKSGLHKIGKIEHNQIKDFYQFIRVPVRFNCYKEYFCCCRFCRLNMLEFCKNNRCTECTPPVLTSQPYENQML